MRWVVQEITNIAEFKEKKEAKEWAINFLCEDEDTQWRVVKI